jgi:hypothetical protein
VKTAYFGLDCACSVGRRSARDRLRSGRMSLLALWNFSAAAGWNLVTRQFRIIEIEFDQGLPYGRSTHRDCRRCGSFDEIYRQGRRLLLLKSSRLTLKRSAWFGICVQLCGQCSVKFFRRAPRTWIAGRRQSALPRRHQNHYYSLQVQGHSEPDNALPAAATRSRNEQAAQVCTSKLDR